MLHDFEMLASTLLKAYTTWPISSASKLFGTEAFVDRDIHVIYVRELFQSSIYACSSQISTIAAERMTCWYKLSQCHVEDGTSLSNDFIFQNKKIWTTKWWLINIFVLEQRFGMLLSMSSRHFTIAMFHLNKVTCWMGDHGCDCSRIKPPPSNDMSLSPNKMIIMCLLLLSNKIKLIPYFSWYWPRPLISRVLAPCLRSMEIQVA